MVELLQSNHVCFPYRYCEWDAVLLVLRYKGHSFNALLVLLRE